MSTIALRRRRLISTIGALVLAALAVSPAAADQDLGETGTVGFHKLVDKGNKGGATCDYKRVKPSPGGYEYEAKLRWINVRPPKVRAIAGSQEVGWRFMVERRDQTAGTPWVLRYTSGIQKDVTSSTANADFSSRGINVIVGTSGANDEPEYLYRVIVKMFWYMTDGSVQGTSTHLVEFYRLVWNNFPGEGTVTFIDEFPCEGWTTGSIN